jgi:hypothetical protein
MAGKEGKEGLEHPKLKSLTERVRIGIRGRSRYEKCC